MYRMFSWIVVQTETCLTSCGENETRLSMHRSWIHMLEGVGLVGTDFNERRRFDLLAVVTSSREGTDSPSGSGNIKAYCRPNFPQEIASQKNNGSEKRLINGGRIFWGNSAWEVQSLMGHDTPHWMRSSHPTVPWSEEAWLPGPDVDAYCTLYTEVVFFMLR